MEKTENNELNKLSDNSEAILTINSFLEWLEGKKYEVVEVDNERSWSQRYRGLAKSELNNLVHEFFSIDKIQLEKERRELLERERQKRSLLQLKDETKKHPLSCPCELCLEIGKKEGECKFTSELKTLDLAQDVEFTTLKDKLKVVVSTKIVTVTWKLSVATIGDIPCKNFREALEGWYQKQRHPPTCECSLCLEYFREETS